MSRLTINSNIASLNAQRNFTTATKKLSESYTRLSSGLRINRAVDDAAGLSISESLKADTRLFNQGVRNLNDGVSVLSIADGALNELSNITIRLRELATQSANGTLGNKQRLALDQEAQSLSKEYNRIARTTEFNGRKLFDGDFGDLSLAAGGGKNTLIESGLGGGIGDGTFQERNSYVTGNNASSISVFDFNRDSYDDIVTTNLSGSISVLLGNADGSFGTEQQYSAGVNPIRSAVNDFNSDGIVDILVTDYAGGFSVLIGNSNGTFKNRISYAQSFPLVSIDLVDLNNDGKLDLVSDGGNEINLFFGNSDGSFTARTSINSGPFSSLGGVKDLNSDGILDLISINGASSTIGVWFGNTNSTFKASITFGVGSISYGLSINDFNNDGVFDIASADHGSNTISVILGNRNGSFNQRSIYATGLAVTSISAADFNGDGIIDLFSSERDSNSVSIFLGNVDGSFKSRTSLATGTSPTFVNYADVNDDGVLDISSTDQNSGTFSVFIGNIRDGIGALQSFSLKTKFESQEAMSYLEDALNRITKQRGHIGAFQSRVETATNNLQQASLAYSEANSRITDADIAEESSKLTANQIIQQAAASVLGQANLQPQLVLGLLRGI
jgi:flagellin-like hook-associated protein FlgL